MINPYCQSYCLLPVRPDVFFECLTHSFQHHEMEIFEFFTVCTKLAERAILYSKDLTTAKKKLPPVGLDLMLQIITGLGVQ